MFEVSVEDSFAAGHSLRNYRGKCENVHGHNYRVRITIEGEAVDPVTGLLVDFVEVKRILRQTMAYLDHQFINDLPPFTELNPSAENIAKYFCDEVGKGLAEGDRLFRYEFRPSRYGRRTPRLPVTGRRRRRSFRRSWPTFPGGRRGRRSLRRGIRARRLRNRCIRRDRCRAVRTGRRFPRPSWGECNRRGRHPRRRCLSCQCRVQR